MLLPVTISGLGIVISAETSKHLANKNALGHFPFLLLKPTPSQITKSYLAQSTKIHNLLLVSMASTGILSPVNFIRLTRSKSMPIGDDRVQVGCMWPLVPHVFLVSGCEGNQEAPQVKDGHELGHHHPRSQLLEDKVLLSR